MKTTTFFLSLTMLLWGSLTFGQWSPGVNINTLTSGDHFGASVSLSANGLRAAVGSPSDEFSGAGQVRIYDYAGGQWTLTATITSNDAPRNGDQFGASVSLNGAGDRLVVGAPFKNTGGINTPGRIYIFNYIGNAWSKVYQGTGEVNNDQFGASVSFSADGNRVAIGAPLSDVGLGGELDRGRVYTLQYSGGSWSDLGNPINGSVDFDECGRSVSLNADGSRVAIGSPLSDGGGPADSGRVRIFYYNAGTSDWEQLAGNINGQAAGDHFGTAISLSNDGNRLVIGAPNNDGGSGIATDDIGRVQVYHYNGAAWGTLGGAITGQDIHDEFGTAVSLSGNGTRVAVGAPYHDGGVGEVYVYELHGTTWRLVGDSQPGMFANEEFGSAVGLSATGAILLAGAPLNDHDALVNSGQVRLFAYSVPDAALGEGAGGDTSNSTGEGNMFLGYYSGFTTTGSNNVFVGRESGYSNTTGSGNVFLGYRAGYDETTGNDHLFIDNSDTPDPLIWGDFAADALRVNGSLAFTNALMPNNLAGSAGQVLTSAGADAAPTWTTLPSNTLLTGLAGGQTVKGGTAASENLTLTSTNHATKGKIQFGTSAYDEVNNRLGIGTASPSEKLEINGNILIGYQQFLKGKRQDGNTSNLIGYNGNILAFSEYSGVPSEVRIYTPWDAGQGVSIYSNQLIAFFRNDGNVGIGTTSPAEKLEISGGNIDSNDGTYFIRNNAGNVYGMGYNTEGGEQMTIFSDDLIDFTESDNNTVIMRIEGNDGQVGIGTTAPNYKLHVNGTAAKPNGGDWINSGSDRRLKQDITPFTDGLEKIKQIKPVWYRYNGLAGLPTGERYVGIIAQEMQEIAPYTVGKFVYQDSTGLAEEYLNYDGSAVTYMLINAIKEQQQQIEALKSALYGSPNATQNLPTSRETSVTGEPQGLPDGFALYQNVPNPFDKSTVIVAQLPESVQQAKIVVYNLQGLELASYPLSERGKVSVEISGGRFPAGMYLYALLADGQVIDTKKMILTN